MHVPRVSGIQHPRFWRMMRVETRLMWPNGFMTWTIDFNIITPACESWRGGWSSYGVIAVFPSQLSPRRTVRGWGGAKTHVRQSVQAANPCNACDLEKGRERVFNWWQEFDNGEEDAEGLARGQPCRNNTVRLAPHFGPLDNVCTVCMLVCNGV